jgi:hypothetical protein
VAHTSPGEYPSVAGLVSLATLLAKVKPSRCLYPPRSLGDLDLADMVSKPTPQGKDKDPGDCGHQHKITMFTYEQEPTLIYMGTTFIHAHTHTTNANLINITSADMTVIISCCPSGLGKSAIATMQSRQLFFAPDQPTPRLTKKAAWCKVSQT